MRRAEVDAAESWAFALAIYARPGIAEACLALQNAADVDVMLMLMATFVAVKRRLLLTADEIKALDNACAPWREQVVHKLRALRTDLKTGPRPAPSETTEPFRSRIKAIELDAEKLENQLLAECLPQRPGQESIGMEQLRSVLNAVVVHFADKRGTTLDARLSPLVDTIAEAAMEPI
ncbi:MAG TPA: TIGR02444 family protein [Bradyrhizobium sp.]|uniref:TIGR02444 family protein n=1 Tax=Bradyrhizobium sp. TaxID=376 RepID=UPI002D80F68B|nr:TIGR02444 family protein [Bradyrhizobium sp.]HET7884866.1 TIGR02444 family protein [Bradyrhizobium sp.]